MRTNTKKFEILKFIGQHRDGVRSRDVEKFIVIELQGKKWDPKRRAGLWNTSLYGMSGHGGIYRDHCVRVGDRWFLNHKTREIVAKANPGEMFFGKTSTPSLADTPCKSDVIHPGTPEAKVMHMPPLLDRPAITPEVRAITDLKAARGKVLVYKQAYDKAAQALLDAQAQEADAVRVVKKVLGL